MGRGPPPRDRHGRRSRGRRVGRAGRPGRSLCRRLCGRRSACRRRRSAPPSHDGIYPMTNPELVLVPHTHWDREWYQPFPEFLERLIQMMDRLIEVLDGDERFAHFHLDGQVAMIDDYLDVRPAREGDIRRLA